MFASLRLADPWLWLTGLVIALSIGYLYRTTTRLSSSGGRAVGAAAAALPEPRVRVSGSATITTFGVSSSPAAVRLCSGVSPPRHFGLVIAHPDDEAMFFVPLLEELRRKRDAAEAEAAAEARGRQVEIHLLCLSSGNSAGLGEQRKQELVRSAIGVLAATSVRVVEDESNLADGLDTVWSVEAVEQHVAEFVQEFTIDMLITFDSYGVSGHPNHIATYEGAKRYLRRNSDLPLLTLLSTPLWRKYLGPLDYLFSRLDVYRSRSQRHGIELISGEDASLSYRAMVAHESQFVWYRRLFVVFSRYGYINTLQQG